VTEGLEDYLFPVYRYVHKRLGRTGTTPDYEPMNQ